MRLRDLGIERRLNLNNFRNSKLLNSIIDFRKLLKKSFFAGCSKMPRCEAPEILRRERFKIVPYKMHAAMTCPVR
jgi:hypothetical protein